MLQSEFHCEFVGFAPLLAQENAFFKNVVTQAFESLSLPDKNYHVNIVLTDDAALRELNRDFRHKDKATNVLSFPQIDDFNKIDGLLQDPIALGDIFLAYETISAEALEQNKSLRDHVAHLLVHGLLHLVGFDHQNDADAEEMEAHEVAVLARVGIENPY